MRGKIWEEVLEEEKAKFVCLFVCFSTKLVLDYLKRFLVTWKACHQVKVRFKWTNMGFQWDR